MKDAQGNEVCPTMRDLISEEVRLGLSGCCECDCTWSPRRHPFKEGPFEDECDEDGPFEHEKFSSRFAVLRKCGFSRDYH